VHGLAGSAALLISAGLPQRDHALLHGIGADTDLKRWLWLGVRGGRGDRAVPRQARRGRAGQCLCWRPTLPSLEVAPPGLATGGLQRARVNQRQA